jgi:hypothetical protein
MMKFCIQSFAELLHIPNYLILFIGIVIFAVFYYLFMYKNRIYYYGVFFESNISGCKKKI